MFPLNPLASWQEFAHGLGRAGFGFAMGKGICQAVGMRSGQPFVGGAQDCYPFPSPWPGPSWVRLFLFRVGRGFAGGFARSRQFFFSIRRNTIESALIITTNRGSSTCVKSSFFPFLPFRWRAASPMTCSVPQSVPALVRFWQTLLTTMSSRALLSAVWLAPFATTSASAADLNSAPRGASTHSPRPTGHPARLVFLHLRPGFWSGRGKTEGTAPCSRKS